MFFQNSIYSAKNELLIYKTTKQFENELNNKIEERKLGFMRNKRFFTATDVQEMLGVSLLYAFFLPVHHHWHHT